MRSQLVFRSKFQNNGCKLLRRDVSSLTGSNNSSTLPLPQVLLLLHKNKEDAKVSRRRYVSSFHLPNFRSIEEEIDDANQRYANLVTITTTTTTTNTGHGLVASKTYQTGDTVLTGRAVVVVSRDSHSIQVGWDHHVRMDLPARFINHSCDANTGVVDNEWGAYDFIALRTIEEGEEVSFDYETTEYRISAFETCRCGSWNCRKKLGGFQKHGEELKKQYGMYIANYLK